MHPVFAELLVGGYAITDGAWGTELQVQGLPIGGCPDAWNIECPDCVEAVAAGYIAAGSAIILTNTFGANRYVLARHGHEDRLQIINRRGVEISRRAAGNMAKVFASIGPTGKMLMKDAGTAETIALYKAFVEQAHALAEGGPDAIVIETMFDLNEAKLAVAAAKETGLPVVACMVYGVGRHSDRTITGVTPEQAAIDLAEAGADAIGTNCGSGAESMLPICARLHAATSLPIWIKPNAGLPEIVAGKAIYHITPEQFVTAALALVEAGASFIGGCCGTNPVYIRAMCAAISSVGPNIQREAATNFAL
jgi:methionine synthase I (cobalamin-dependent)